MVKSQIIIYIYDLLINNQSFTKEDIISEFNISERTFRRYISEINCYFDNFYINQCIVYDSSKNVYKLKEY